MPPRVAAAVTSSLPAWCSQQPSLGRRELHDGVPADSGQTGFLCPASRRGQAGSAAVEAGDPHAAESCHPPRNWQSSLGHSRTAFQFVNERGALACSVRTDAARRFLSSLLQGPRVGIGGAEQQRCFAAPQLLLPAGGQHYALLSACHRRHGSPRQPQQQVARRQQQPCSAAPGLQLPVLKPKVVTETGERAWTGRVRPR